MNDKELLLGGLYHQIESQKEFAELGNSLERLKKNKDFIKVFEDFIFDKKLKEKIRDLANEKDTNNKETIVSQIIGIETVVMLLEQITQEAQLAGSAIESAEAEINNLLEE